MHFVYILQSDRDQGFYIGRTDDIARRFVQHTDGKVDATMHRRPLRLVYYEAYPALEQASEREQKLKQFGSAYTGLLKRLKLK